MNIALSKLESEPARDINYPTVFVFGLPRSGTTLLYQLIAQCLDLGYINNLIARFWLRPDYGIALSQAILEPLKEANYQSKYGRTKGAYGPHEFGYFWNHWLKIRGVDDLIRYDYPSEEIDWPGLGRVVRCMQEMFQSGIVLKAMLAPNHMKAFAETFAMPLFVYIERDPIDVALSLLSVRREYFGKVDTWWSLYPPNYLELKSYPFDRQIAGQVQGLNKTHERVLELVSSEITIKVRYEDMCMDPSTVIRQIRRRLRDAYGVDVGPRLIPPKSFLFQSRPAVLDEEQRAVLTALTEWST